MTRQLPPNASLEHLRKQAKDLLKVHRKGDPSCCRILRHIHELAGKSDPDILRMPISLRQVQFALAMDYGFSTWRELKMRVDGAREKRLENITQPPLNATMMGVLKGAADYHGLDLDTPMIYGFSGHAFLINIHTEICPSGPYCWKREEATPLIANMGLRMTDLGFFGTGAESGARAGVERRLRAALDRRIPCSLLNLENQIISGYDGTGFFTAQPWAPRSTFPPSRLTFGSWEEFGKEFHASFYTLEKSAPADRQTAILASLDYAVDLWRNPSEHGTQGNGVGPKAYENWIAAVPTAGSGHGNWWNATVWSECRQMAAAYVSEIGKANARVADLCAQVSDAYRKIAENLGKARDKTMAPEPKVKLLRETRHLEDAAISGVQRLAAGLRAPKAP